MSFFAIKNFKGTVIYAGEAQSLSMLVQEAAKTGASLAGADLSNQSLENVNLEKINLNKANLTGATFRRCNLTGAKVFLTKISKVKFDHCDLSEISFIQQKVEECQFFNCNFLNTDFEKSSWKKAKFNSCFFKRNVISEASFEGCDFFTSKFISIQGENTAVFLDCELSNASLENKAYSNLWLMHEVLKKVKNSEINEEIKDKKFPEVQKRLLEEKNLKHQALALFYFKNQVENLRLFLENKYPLVDHRAMISNLLTDNEFSFTQIFKILVTNEMIVMLKEKLDADKITEAFFHYYHDFKFCYLFHEYINQMVSEGNKINPLTIYLSYHSLLETENLFTQLQQKSSYRWFYQVFQKFSKIKALSKDSEAMAIMSEIKNIKDFKDQHLFLYKTLGFKVYSSDKIDYINAQRKYINKIDQHLLDDKWQIHSATSFRQVIEWETKLKSLTNYDFCEKAFHEKLVCYGAFALSGELEAVFLLNRRTVIDVIGKDDALPSEELMESFRDFALNNNKTFDKEDAVA